MFWICFQAAGDGRFTLECLIEADDGIYPLGEMGFQFAPSRPAGSRPEDKPRAHLEVVK